MFAAMAISATDDAPGQALPDQQSSPRLAKVVFPLSVALD